MNVIDFFSGCGGLSYGFVQAGYNVIIGIDNDKAALQSFEFNHPNSLGLMLDLFDEKFIEALDEKVANRTVDIIIGGPPCQGFSLTGARDSNDKRNQLFRSMFLAIDKYQPKVVVIENVPGLKTLYGGYYYNEITKEFDKRKYHWEAKVLYAPEYGIPQIRRRLVFIATRQDLMPIKHPIPIITDPKKYITTEEAISDLPSVSNGEMDEFIPYESEAKFAYAKKMREGSSGIYNHIPTIHSNLVISVISQVPEGGNYKDLPKGVGESRKFNEAWTRYDRHKPSKTIDTGHRNHFHYLYNRIPTVRENARLQSFPDKFIFKGTKTQQYRQVGNAVPPILGYHIAKAIDEQLSKKKITTIDLFAGCGGLMDGFEQSGLYTTLACVEWDKAPCNNLVKRLSDKWQYNDAPSRVLRFDIQRTDELFDGWANDIEYGSSTGLNSLIGNNKLDLIIGGPPCQAYSIAGRIRDEYNMKKDYRNYLFESYLKVVSRYKPKAFVFENVPGILSAKPGDRYIIEIIKEQFEHAGYVLLDDLHDALIDFTDYGVPQNRSRMIILGLNESIYPNAKELLHEFYKEVLPKYKVNRNSTVYEAIGDLPKLYPILDDGRQKYSHTLCECMIANHVPRWHSKRDIEIFRLLAEDIEQGKFQYISTESLKQLYTEKTGKISNVHKYHVLRWDEPSNLIPAHLYKDGLRHIHPDSRQARTITVREAARLQTFSDDYVFIGNQMEQYKMIGNAVPPLFAQKLAQAINDLLFK